MSWAQRGDAHAPWLFRQTASVNLLRRLLNRACATQTPIPDKNEFVAAPKGLKTTPEEDPRRRAQQGLSPSPPGTGRNSTSRSAHRRANEAWCPGRGLNYGGLNEGRNETVAGGLRGCPDEPQNAP